MSLREMRYDRRRNRRAGAVSLVLLLVVTPHVSGWHQQGHALATRAGVAAASPRLPEFFAKGVDTIVHCVTDPDLATHPDATLVRVQERPEHYLDLELLGGAALPPTRYEFIRLCQEKSLRPEDVGLLPYAIAEWTQRLTLALAEHRKFPDDPHVRSKCLVYAGILAHYAQDLCQPLHTTIHYDGRVPEGGKSPRSGIHSLVDALPTHLHLDPARVDAGSDLAPLDELLPGIMAELRRSHALVDRTYELEPLLPSAKSSGGPSPDAAVFGADRMRASARFTAVLLLTAWRDSERVELPAWVIEAHAQRN